MASDWVETNLGEIVDFLSGGTPFKGNTSYWNGSIPWVSAKDMKRFFIDDTKDHVTEEGLNNGTKLVPEKTVFLLTRGMTLLNDVPICIARCPMTFNQDVKAIRPKGEVYEEYIPYLLLGNKQRLLSLVDLAGHGTGRLNTDELKNLDIHLPPLTEQRAIAHILSTIDEKIELNCKMNETLEAMAQSIFKSWFVDFDPVRAKMEGRDMGIPSNIADLFPDSFEDSELEKIPQGWEVGTLGELISLDKGLSYKGQYLADYGIPMVNLGCFIGHGKFNTTAFKYYTGEFKPRHTVEIGDLVLANTDITQKREVLGSPGIIPPVNGQDKLIFTHHVYAARFHESKQWWKCFVYFTLLRDEFRERATGFATGTTVLALPQDSVLQYQFVHPPKTLIDTFNNIIIPIIERQWKRNEESTSLTALRDALLPKLISGEIRVNDMERPLDK